MSYWSYKPYRSYAAIHPIARVSRVTPPAARHRTNRTYQTYRTSAPVFPAAATSKANVLQVLQVLQVLRRQLSYSPRIAGNSPRRQRRPLLAETYTSLPAAAGNFTVCRKANSSQGRVSGTASHLHGRQRRHQSAGTRATRMPSLLLRSSGYQRFRYAERQITALRNQLPPRHTRIEPDSGPAGSVALPEG